MKRILLSSVALAGLTAGALAADLPMRAAPVAAVAPAFTWTGFYVGANIGSGWRNRDSNFFGDPGLITLGAVPGFQQPVVPAAGGFFGQNFGNGTAPLAGILGGVQIGYNWQVTPGHGWVVGVEGDIQIADLSGRNNENGGFLGNGFGAFGTPGFGAGFGGFQAAAATPAAQTGVGFGVAGPTAAATPNNIALFNNFGGNRGFVNNRNSRGDWFGTARVRLGYAVDRILFYATGGVAFADSRNNNNNFGVGFGGFGNTFANGAAVVAAAPGFFIPGGAAAALNVNPTNATGFFGNSRNRSNDIGAAVGVGIEWAWTNNLSVKMEGMGLLFDTGGRNTNGFVGPQVVGVTNTGAPITATNAVGTTRRGSGGSDIWLVRSGINYRFSL